MLENKKQLPPKFCCRLKHYNFCFMSIIKVIKLLDLQSKVLVKAKFVAFNLMTVLPQAISRKQKLSAKCLRAFFILFHKKTFSYYKLSVILILQLCACLFICDKQR